MMRTLLVGGRESKAGNVVVTQGSARNNHRGQEERKISEEEERGDPQGGIALG